MLAFLWLSLHAAEAACGDATWAALGTPASPRHSTQCAEIGGPYAATLVLIEYGKGADCESGCIYSNVCALERGSTALEVYASHRQYRAPGAAVHTYPATQDPLWNTRAFAEFALIQIGGTSLGVCFHGSTFDDYASPHSAPQALTPVPR